MTEVQLRPLLFALSASLFSLFLLVIVWPRFVAPPPVPFLESLLQEIRAQNYDVVYSHLAQRWQGPKMREYIEAKFRDQGAAIRMGGFVESTVVAADRVQVKDGEASIPVSYRLKVATIPPRVWEGELVVKLVYEQTRWRLDDLRAR